jgi:hypothetical protein
VLCGVFAEDSEREEAALFQRLSLGDFFAWIGKT